MTSMHEAEKNLITQLRTLYDNREAATMADWTMEAVTSWKKPTRLVNKEALLSPPQEQQLAAYTRELLQHKPVQYVLHEAWFCAMPFYVNEHVLIPRPETEELVQWVVEAGSRRPEIGPQTSDLGPPTSDLRILDIGTGSGCIPISIKKKWPAAKVVACDISEQALAVAQKNATTLGAEVQFIQVDILNPASWPQLPAVDIIVSNPPYIPQSDKASMHANVLEHEPHIALFVPNNDPLLFYKAIAGFAQQKLSLGGQLFAEIHEDLGEATKALFLEKGFHHVEVRKDFQGKERMIKCSL